MTAWRAFERRWRDELCRAAVPAVDGHDLPAWEDLDTERFWREFSELAPARLQRGWRITVWALTIRSRLQRPGRPRLGRRSRAAQDAYLAALVHHRSPAVRQLGSVLCLVACFGYLGDAGLRARIVEEVSP